MPMNYKGIKKPSLNKYLQERWSKLVGFDKIRGLKILEMSQYTIVYFIAVYVSAQYIDSIFPKFNEFENKGFWRILLEVIGQLVVNVISIFYIRKIVKLVPFIFYNNKDYVPGFVDEAQGEIIVNFVYVALQTELMKKLDYLRRIDNIPNL